MSRNHTTLRLSNPQPRRIVPLAIISQADLRRVQQAIACDPDNQDVSDITTLVLHTGLRALEVIELRWKDVDVFDRQIAISHRSGVRQVPFNNEVLRVLLGRRPDESSSDYVFGRRAFMAASRKLSRISREVIGYPVSLHDFRRLFITRLLRCGMPPGTMMALMGWSTPTMLLHYLSATVVADGAGIKKQKQK